MVTLRRIARGVFVELAIAVVVLRVAALVDGIDGALAVVPATGPAPLDARPTIADCEAARPQQVFVDLAVAVVVDIVTALTLGPHFAFAHPEDPAGAPLHAGRASPLAPPARTRHRLIDLPVAIVVDAVADFVFGIDRAPAHRLVSPHFEFAVDAALYAGLAGAEILSAPSRHVFVNAPIAVIVLVVANLIEGPDRADARTPVAVVADFDALFATTLVLTATTRQRLVDLTVAVLVSPVAAGFGLGLATAAALTPLTVAALLLAPTAFADIAAARSDEIFIDFAVAIIVDVVADLIVRADAILASTPSAIDTRLAALHASAARISARSHEILVDLTVAIVVDAVADIDLGTDGADARTELATGTAGDRATPARAGPGLTFVEWKTGLGDRTSIRVAVDGALTIVVTGVADLVCGKVLALAIAPRRVALAGRGDASLHTAAALSHVLAAGGPVVASLLDPIVHLAITVIVDAIAGFGQFVGTSAQAAQPRLAHQPATLTRTHDWRGPART